MKILMSLALAGLLASTALATLSLQVYRADEQTPLLPADPNIPDVYQDIMVGTRLTMFVVSDAPASVWSGGLRIPWDHWSRGTVAARGYNPDTRNFERSILPASGLETYLIDTPGSDGMTYSMSVDTALPGEWMALDYHAEALGTCDIGLFSTEASAKLPPDFNPLFGEPPPGKAVWVQALSFNHVLSRDYNADLAVNFVDFALWASQWSQTVIPDPNVTSPGDLNADDFVDVSDLALFCNYWLERTDVNEPPAEPNTPDPAA